MRLKPAAPQSFLRGLNLFRSRGRRQPGVDEEPVLVYQMGKVGSTSVRHTLEALGFEVLHLHNLNQQTRARLLARHDSRGLRPPRHYETASYVRRTLLGRRKLRIVTLVREPVSRNISAYFENLSGYGSKRLARQNIHQLINDFLHRYPHDTPLHWFDREIREVVGIDVFEHSFPKDGYQILDAQPARLLIMKAEADDTVKARALAAFLNLPSVTMRRANVGSTKVYKHAYKALLEQIRLPANYLDHMYQSRLAQHFYSSEEILAFRTRWLGAGSLELSRCFQSVADPRQLRILDRPDHDG